MKTLESYLLGAWHAGQGEPAILVDPTTEEPIAECRSADVDWQAVLEHARQVGGPALRALSFQERGELLKALAAAIHEYREELIELSMQNGGCTRGDAKFDIDGATGTLAAYARFARALPEGALLPDGEGIQLGRTPRFWGQHVRVPLQGAAVHINAFNFPAWGQCEKMACALLAGVPVSTRPHRTPTRDKMTEARMISGRSYRLNSLTSTIAIRKIAMPKALMRNACAFVCSSLAPPSRSLEPSGKEAFAM